MDYRALKNIEKRLELLAGFATGSEKFSFSLNPKSEDSWWDYKKKKVQIGIAEFKKDVAKLSELVTWHEVGHIKFTKRDIDVKSLGFPFSLLNVLEDARIEAAMAGKDFAPLHISGYNHYYINQEAENPDLFKNPFNIGILLRWRRWEVETKTEKPDDLSDEQYKDFLSDWNNAIDASIKGIFDDVCANAKYLYDKWQWLFDKSNDCDGAGGGGASEKTPHGSVEKTQAGASGNGTLIPGEGGGEDAQIEETPDGFFGTSSFDWDMDYIKEQVFELKKILDFKTLEERCYKLTGRRISPQRVENPPLLPFKNKSLTSKHIKIKKLLIVIDGSGSMSNGPFKNAAHVAFILKEVFESDIKVVTNHAKKPIEIEDINTLRGFKAWGGSENYRSVGIPTGYSFVLFLTDADISDPDKNYIKNRLNKAVKVGAGYVGNLHQRLEETFIRNFYDTELSKGVARMIGLFLRRHFTVLQR